MGENTNRSEPFFDEDVDLVKLQFTDIFGQCKMVQMTRRQAEKAMKEGYAINRFALGGLQKAGIEGAAAPEYLTDQSESVELYLKPDASTYQILPWDSGQENVARVICQVCNADGTPSWTDSRHILQETVKRAEKMGLDFDFDFQCEFYLFHTDDDGRPTTVTHEVAGYYDAGPIDLAEGVRRDMVLSLEEAGFEDDFVTFYNTHLGTSCDGAGIGLKFADAYGDLTFCNGIVKTEDGVISCTIDIRVPVTLKEEELRSMCEGKLEDENGRIEIRSVGESLFFPADSPLVTALYKAYVDVTGDTENKPMVIGGGTYAKSLKNIIAFGPEMPGIDYRIHSADEYILVSGMEESVLIYMEAIKNLLAI